LAEQNLGLKTCLLKNRIKKSGLPKNFAPYFFGNPAILIPWLVGIRRFCVNVFENKLCHILHFIFSYLKYNTGGLSNKAAKGYLRKRFLGPRNQNGNLLCAFSPAEIRESFKGVSK